MLTDKSCMTNLPKHHFHVYKFNVSRIVSPETHKVTKSQHFSTSTIDHQYVLPCLIVAQHLGSQPLFHWTFRLGPFGDGPHIGPRPSAIAHPTWWRCLSAIATRGDQWWRLGWNYAKRWICFMFILIWEMIQFDSTLIFGNHWKTSNVEVKHLWWWFG